MPRFAILTHDHPSLHWDLLLEGPAACRTWRLADEPALGGSGPAEAIADHRLIYLDYEGPVSGGRGTVARWDAGWFEPVCEQSNVIVIRLAGERLCGTCRLTRVDEMGWRVAFGGE